MGFTTQLKDHIFYARIFKQKNLTTSFQNWRKSVLDLTSGVAGFFTQGGSIFFVLTNDEPPPNTAAGRHGWLGVGSGGDRPSRLGIREYNSLIFFKLLIAVCALLVRKRHLSDKNFRNRKQITLWSLVCGTWC